MLERVANLRDKISIFLKEQKHELVDRFYKDIWIVKLLFLADFFSNVNQLNGSTVQGVRKVTIQSYKLLYRHPVIY